MASKLGLFKGALLKVKQRPISALTDTDESRYTLDTVYDDVVAMALSAGNWNFAGRSVAIEASTDVEPEFGFAYAVEKPSDWVRTVQIAGNGDFWPQLDAGEYVDEGEFWNCNVDPLYIRYVSDHTSYGGDLSLWPAAFSDYVEWELASHIAPHLTSMSVSELDWIEKQKQRALNQARSLDAFNQAPDRKPVGRLVRARTGNRSQWGPRRQW